MSTPLYTNVIGDFHTHHYSAMAICTSCGHARRLTAEWLVTWLGAETRFGIDVQDMLGARMRCTECQHLGARFEVGKFSDTDAERKWRPSKGG